MVREAIIEMMLEGSLSITSYLQGMLVELNDVPVDPLTILHAKAGQLMLCIANRVMGAEITF